MRSRAGNSSADKIYLTRTGLSFSGCVGEEYFENYYRSLGYEIVSPERLPFKQQVALIGCAKEIATTMGTLANQVMFACAGTKLTVLNRSSLLVKGVIMSAQSAKADATFVDVFMSILPEEQAGNCVYLLGPTKLWEECIRYTSGISGSQGVEYPLAENLLEYVTLWGKQYRDPKKFDWIRNETVPSIVKRVNQYLLGSSIDISKHGIPKRFEKLRDDNAFLREEIRRKRNRIRELECKYLQSSYATFEWRDETIIVSGTIDTTTIADLDDFEIHASYKIDRKGFEIDDYPLSITVRQRDESSIEYVALLAYSEICEHYAQYGEVDLSMRISLMVGANTISMPVKIDYNNQRYSYFGNSIDENAVALRVNEFADALICTIIELPKIDPMSYEYMIEQMCWENGLAKFVYTVKQPLIGHCGFEHVIELGNPQANDREFYTIKPIEETGDEHWPNSRRYTMCVDPSKLFDPNEDVASAEYNIYLAFNDLSKGLSLNRKPFGRKRPTGSYAEFSREAIRVDGGIILGREDDDRNLYFRYLRDKDAVEEPTAPRIEELRWQGDTLVLGGRFEKSAGMLPLMDTRFVLVDEGGDVVPVCDIEASGERGDEWRFEVQVGGLADKDRRGNYTFAVSKSMAGAVSVERFGKARKPGMADAFRSRLYVGGGIAVVPEETAGKCLGFEIGPVGDLFEERGDVRIGELEWAGDVLRMSLAMRDAFSMLEGYSVEVGLASAPGRFVGINARMSREQDLIRWEVEEDAAGLLSGCEAGDWTLAVRRTLGDMTSVSAFGKHRPAGTLAKFEREPIKDRQCVMRPRQYPGSLGFEIAVARV